LLTRYVHGQLRPEQTAQVVNHVRQCARCRAALAREECLARDLRDELRIIGPVRPSVRTWAAVWGEISRPRRGLRALAEMWVPALTLALALAVTLAIALPVFAGDRWAVQAALQQPLPVSMASPTPGATDTSEALVDRAEGLTHSAATASPVSLVGASPVPMPAATVSPEAVRGSFWQ
jgi:anti-sigma factor RsiW